MTLEQEARNEELLKTYLANIQTDIDIPNLGNKELSALALGAELAAKARDKGLSIDDVINRRGQRLRQEQASRMLNNPRLAEHILESMGLGMTEDDLVSNNKLGAEDAAAYGVGSFEEDVDMRRDSGKGFGVGDAERRQMRDIRKKRAAGKPVNAEYEQKVSDRFAQRQADQVFFDAGLKPFGDNAIYAFKGKPPEVVGERDGKTVKRYYPGVEADDAQEALVPRSILTNDDRKEDARANREQGVLAKAENERRIRGDLTEAEMEREARLERGKVTPEKPVDAFGRVPLGAEDVYKYDQAGNFVGKVEAQRTRAPGAGGFVNPDEAQSAILGQLRARKDRGRNGLIEAIQQDNYGKANAEAILGGVRGTRGEDAGKLVSYPGRTSANIQGRKNVSRLPDIQGLGKAKLGAAGPRRFDMSIRKDDGELTGGRIGMNYPPDDVVISQQRPTGIAGMVGRPDGTIYAVDARSGNLIPGNVDIGPAPVAQQLGSFAEQMNAPQMESAARFVAENAYDNYGAQNFGDESILSAMMEDSGSGGGVRPVEITGTLNELNQRLAKKGVVIPDGIRGVADLQAAAEQLIAASPKKKFFTRPGGNKMVFNENPGVAEVLESLKYAKFEQEQIANALLQTQLAQASDINLEAKARYEGGGRVISPNRTLGSLANNANIVFGVNDPAKGGDTLDIGKAPAKRQEEFRQLTAQDGGAASKDSTKPFVGQIAGAPNRVGDTQVYRGMDPVQVRQFYQQQSEANRQKKAAKSGKRSVGAGSQSEQMALAARIRAAQEGNMIARFRKNQADAVSRSVPRNEGGRIIPGTPVPDALRSFPSPIQAEVVGRQMEMLKQRANNMPVSQRPAAQLLPRPQMPSPSATPMTMGGDPQVATGPARGFPTNDDLKQSMEKSTEQLNNLGKMIYEKGKEYATSNAPGMQRNRRIGYATVGVGGLLGALIGGERDARNEEEQYR